MDNFLVKNSSPPFSEEGATFYTQDWLDGPSYSLPPNSKVQIVALHSNGTFEVIAIEINIYYIYEDLLSDWEGPNPEDYDYEYMSDDEWSDICWDEAEYRKDEMQEEIYIVYPEDFMGEDDKPSNFLITPNKKEKEVFAKAIKQTKTLRFHRLSKLLKEKTRGFLAKVSGFFKKKKELDIVLSSPFNWLKQYQQQVDMGKSLTTLAKQSNAICEEIEEIYEEQECEPKCEEYTDYDIHVTSASSNTGAMTSIWA